VEVQMNKLGVRHIDQLNFRFAAAASKRCSPSGKTDVP
jgi:hypothetical protein